MLLFLLLYCLVLFLFRILLLNLEKQYGFILKPEVFHIFIIGFLILLYYFFFLGLYVFSTLGSIQKIYAICIALIVVLGLLYGFKQWYSAVANNPFLSINNLQNLPWYAKEEIKFLLVNTPLLLFFITVFVYRLLMITKISNKK